MKSLSKSRRSWFDRAATRCGLVAAFLGSFGGVTPLRAASHCPCSQCSPASWHAVETANFRILTYGCQCASRETGEKCEATRATLAEQWLGTTLAPNWTPKCDIVLHPSDAAYLREVGGGAGSTVASSLIDRKEGRIATRRIDVRGTQPNWQTAALGHEMTHIVLADRFADRPLPRWVDEGMAILADSREKQRLHRQDLKKALESRSQFRVLELITLADYPPAQRWGTFYGQSAALVQYLVEQGGERRFVEFVQLSLDQGYEPALRQVYQVGIAELEQRWQARFKSPARDLAVSQETARPSHSVRPVSLNNPRRPVSVSER